MSDPMLRPLFNTHAQIACIGELQTREVKHLQRIAVLEKALGFYALGSWVDGGRTACAALADKGKDAP